MAGGLQSLLTRLTSDRARVAKVVFSLGALIGTLGVGAGSLGGATYSSGNVWATAAAFFVPIAALWLAFCYGAHRGLASSRVLLRLLFWLFVLAHVFVFPVGTAISGVCVWLWMRRDASSSG
jgi:hypothetical protein